METTVSLESHKEMMPDLIGLFYNMQKIKIYDFDKTLVKGDSITHLVKYGIDNKIICRSFIVKTLFKSALKYFDGYEFEKFKSFTAIIVSKFNDEELEEFAKWHLQKNGFKNLINEIQEKDYVTILCSASLERYIKIFGRLMGFDYVIGTCHDEKQIIGKNNVREEKLKRLQKLFNQERITVDFINSMAFTDSFKNDKWMSSPCSKKYLVNGKNDVEGFINIKGVNDEKK